MGGKVAKSKWKLFQEVCYNKIDSLYVARDDPPGIHWSYVIPFCLGYEPDLLSDFIRINRTWQKLQTLCHF